MDLLLVLLGILVAVIGLLLIAALFIRKEYTIKRIIVINRSPREVFAYVRFLKNQDYYSKWVMTDPAMNKIYRGVDGTVGFVYGWDGNKKAGKGEQEIIALKEAEAVDIEVRFVRPFESIARTPMMLQRTSDNQTKVIWGMEGKSNYPLNLMTFVMRNVLGKDLETSLESLKRILEERTDIAEAVRSGVDTTTSR